MLRLATFPLILALTLGPGQHRAQAQGLSDPMRPPAFAAPASAGESSSAGGLVLQSTLVSDGRRIAMIDGKPMKVGDRIGAARIVSIDASTVTLREAKTIRVLKLYQGVEVTRPGAAKTAASRNGAKEGTK